MAASRVTKSWHRKGAPKHYARESILNSKENREDKEQSVWLSSCNKSSTGIGRAAATLLASKGAKTVLADVDETKAKEAVKELRLAGYRAICVVGDALDEGFPAKAVDAASASR